MSRPCAHRRARYVRSTRIREREAARVRSLGPADRAHCPTARAGSRRPSERAPQAAAVTLDKKPWQTPGGVLLRKHTLTADEVRALQADRAARIAALERRWQKSAYTDTQVADLNRPRTELPLSVNGQTHQV